MTFKTSTLRILICAHLLLQTAAYPVIWRPKNSNKKVHDDDSVHHDNSDHSDHSSSLSSTSPWSNNTHSSNRWVFWYYYYSNNGTLQKTCGNVCIITFTIVSLIILTLILCACWRCYSIRQQGKSHSQNK